MGQDKGLMVGQGTFWIQRLYQTLSALSLPIYVSINAQQQAAYQAVVPDASLVVDSAGERANGPLTGLLSVARQHPQAHALVVPCDMPDMSAEVCQLWQQSFQHHYPAYDALVCQTADRLQPLCGIYGQMGLQKLQGLATADRLRHRSMHDLLENELRTYRLTVPDDMLFRFKNYNTPGDIS